MGISFITLRSITQEGTKWVVCFEHPFGFLTRYYYIVEIDSETAEVIGFKREEVGK